MTIDVKAAGDKVRRAVLGDAHVDRSRANVSDFTREFQDLATEYCWGSLWTRDALDLKSRSLVNVGILAALGRMKEFEMHVGGAVRNGATDDEIKEVLLHVTIYCGVPAGNEAFGIASRVLSEMGGSDNG